MALGDLIWTPNPEDADEYSALAIRQILPNVCPSGIWKGQVRFERFTRLVQYYLCYRSRRSDWTRLSNTQHSIDRLLEEEQYEEIGRNHLWSNFAPAYEDRIGEVKEGVDGENKKLWEAVSDDLEQIATEYIEWDTEEQSAANQDED